MKVENTKLFGAYIIEPEVFGDARGYFFESFSEIKLQNAGLKVPRFVQDNQSYSAKKGVLRGLHCQISPHAQCKLIRCTRGAISDVIVDIREGSPSFMQWIKVLLSAENKRQLYIPKGFLHGFVTLTDDVEVEYKVDEYYNKAADRSIRYDDPVFHIAWDEEEPTLSEKDKNAPLLENSDVKFTFCI